ncbi:unnamed protein product [Moneuplotes crassus]|uniref:RING-type domain-containing protein n=1 Tax=Euplotes crassus TaxID=5936 RepID=A0AAD1XSX6_EUPCR|nr:unnamed protein product [Moneuplotes crassus]
MGCNCSTKSVKKPNKCENKPILYEELDLECIICMTIKKSPYLTNCCKKIVCAECAAYISEKCPLRCKNEGPLFGTNPDLDYKIKNEFHLCERCGEKYHPWDMNNHQDLCMKDELPKEIEVSAIHEHHLIEVDAEGEWKCSMRTNFTQSHHDFFSHKCFTCKKCSLKFCRTCILDQYFYKQSGSSEESDSENSDSSTLKTPSSSDEHSEFDSAEIRPSDIMLELVTNRMIVRKDPSK